MSNNVFDTFEDQVQSQQDEMIEILDSINVDDINSKAMVIQIGGKTIKFSGVEIAEDDLETKIRKEYKDKLNAQQQRIREKINNKINQLLTMHRQKSEEMTRKEAELERKYRNTAKMPDINYNHLTKGLSVVKGSGNDELVWVFRAVYNPKFLDHKPLPNRIINKIKTDVLIVVDTKGAAITGVSTRTVDPGSGLDYFDHYHQSSPDCWGSWKRPSKWSNADDIIKCAKDAEAVLQNINSGSVAHRTPAGLPRLDTLKKHVRDVDAYEQSDVQKSEVEEVDVWST